MLIQVILTSSTIPPNKFGGAERVVHFLDLILKQKNQATKVISSDNINNIINQINLLSLKKAIILCHSDWITYILASKYKNHIVLHYSHYPYAEIASSLFDFKIAHFFYENLLNTIRVWRYILRYFFQIIYLNTYCDNVIFLCLSKKIYNNLSIYVDSKRIYYFPYPIFVNENNIPLSRNVNKFLYVGKIEYRKKQAILQKLIPNGIVSYVGPKGNSNFNYNSMDYFGEVPQNQLEDMYRSHKGLILASSGEAMPQVLFEALSRGLPVFCTEEAAWDFKKSNSIYIFEDINSLANFIKTNPSIPKEAYTNARSMCMDLIDHDFYYKKYICPIFEKFFHECN